MHCKIVGAFVLIFLSCANVWSAETVYPKIAETDAPFGIVEISDFSLGAIPIYNSVDGEPVDGIVFELKDYASGRFYATSAQNSLKFYPYQIWQGEDVANEARNCNVDEKDRYLLQLEVVGDVSGQWLKIVSHFSMGCPPNINGVPMYIPYGIRAEDGKVPGALDLDAYFLIKYDPAYMRLKSWGEVFREAETICNYGGLEIFDKPGGVMLETEGFYDCMRIIGEPVGGWVMVENSSGGRGWLQWREGTGLSRYIDDLGPSRYDKFQECFEN